MKNIIPIKSILLLSIISWSCGPSLKVSSDYDKNADFTKYKTYALYHNDSISDAISQLNQSRIIAAIKDEMTKKGFQEASGTPDVWVNTTAIFKDRVSISSSTNYYGYGGAYRPYYYGGLGGYNLTNTDVYHYKDGSLIIDVIDASNKNLIWQGIGNNEIDGPIKDADVKIPKAITLIMASFPPGKSKK